jgi:hypothetical protein
VWIFHSLQWSNLQNHLSCTSFKKAENLRITCRFSTAHLVDYGTTATESAVSATRDQGSRYTRRSVAFKFEQLSVVKLVVAFFFNGYEAGSFRECASVAKRPPNDDGCQLKQYNHGAERIKALVFQA